MGLSFRDSLDLDTQRLDLHTAQLGERLYLVDEPERKSWPLHDLRCWLTGTWFEAKTDRSNFTNRLLVEYKANVPSWLLDRFPFRQEIPHQQASDYVNSLPSTLNALATDTANLEPKHLLSYLFLRNGAHYVLDVRQLRRQLEEHAYPWFICGSVEDRWRTVCQVVPLDDCEPI